MPFWFLPIPAQAATISVGDRTETRARVDASQVVLDVETRPSVTLGVSTHRASYALSYTPSFSVINMGAYTDADPLVYHSASLRAGWRWRRATFSISESGSYGRQNFRALAVGAPVAGAAPGQAPPPPAGSTAPQVPAQTGVVDQTAGFGSSTTTLWLTYALTRLWQTSASGGYVISGGVDAASRELIPVQRGPFAALTATYRASRVDAVTLSLSGRESETGGLTTTVAGVPTATLAPTRAVLIGLDVGLSHSFAATVKGSLTAGAAYADTRTFATSAAAESTDRTVVPVVVSTLAQNFKVERARVAMTYTIGLTPNIDRFAGTIDNRVTWAIASMWTRHRLTLGANVAGLQSIDPTNDAAVTAYGGGVQVMMRFNRHWSYEAGIRAAWQKYVKFDALPPTGTLYLALTYSSGLIDL
jgi:hypothetical protein